MTQNIESRGTDDELVNAVTDAQMNVECLEATLQDTREELCEQYGEVEQLKLTVERMTVALEQISTIVADEKKWEGLHLTALSRGRIIGLCHKAGIDVVEALPPEGES